jgi:hypothetical protein
MVRLTFISVILWLWPIVLQLFRATGPAVLPLEGILPPGFPQHPPFRFRRIHTIQIYVQCP